MFMLLPPRVEGIRHFDNKGGKCNTKTVKVGSLRNSVNYTESVLGEDCKHQDENYCAHEPAIPRQEVEVPTNKVPASILGLSSLIVR